MKFTMAVLLAALPLAAQDIKMPANLDKLAAKASEVVDVQLDGALIQLASRFLSDKDPDEAHVKRLVAGLKGIYVKSFEFDDRDEYKASDVEDLRAQLRAPTGPASSAPQQEETATTRKSISRPRRDKSPAS